MEKITNFSVLISVYKKEVPKNFDECLKSVFSQTRPASEVVLVCDGPLTVGLDAVIEKYSAEYGKIFRVIRLKKHCGTGAAANTGIKACKNELIMKMDSDDICRPCRFEKQAEMFEKDPALALAGGYIMEFSDKTGEQLAIKKVPLTHREIVKFSRRRNPINNPTIAIKKSAALKIGGFICDSRCEDYDFVCRLLASGAKAANTDEILADYRVTEDNYKRRKNWKNTKAFIAVRWKNLQRGWCSPLDFVIPCVMQLGIFILPSSLTGLLYKKFMRD